MTRASASTSKLRRIIKAFWYKINSLIIILLYLIFIDQKLYLVCLVQLCFFVKVKYQHLSVKFVKRKGVCCLLNGPGASNELFHGKLL